MDAILAKEGGIPLWAVVNNAACLVFGEIEWQTRRQIQLQADVNLVGPILVTKAFLPLLRVSSGRILNLTSQSVEWALPFYGPYGASKAGLEAASDSLRLEMKKFFVDVVLLDPGNHPMATPLNLRQKVGWLSASIPIAKI